MIDIGNSAAEVCVVARPNFASGIGAVGFAAAELLSRHYTTCFLPTEDLDDTRTITLPTGRIVPICADSSEPKVFFYTDVVWNGAYDQKHQLVPAHGLRVAHIAFDSDELPERWVDILNERFDVALFSCNHLEDVARNSGVNIPVGTLPIGLDLEPLLARSWTAPTPGRVRFGSIAAFHDRKGVSTLVRAFREQFGSDPSVELVVHSNLAIGDSYDEVVRLAEALPNVTVSLEDLSDREKSDLLDSFDVLVSCSRGEGYSIGPREALALGKVLVLSGIDAHRDMLGVPGAFEIPTSYRVPARYPEIDNQIFGHQHSVQVAAVRQSLLEAAEFVRSDGLAATVIVRRARAAEFSFSTLSNDYAEVIDATVRRFRTRAKGSMFTSLPEDVRRCAIDTVGAQARHLKTINRTVVPAHDGGFFSVFNSFVSHLTWDLDEDRCHLVLPDWDVSRLVERTSPRQIQSFCYGKPGGGNIWLDLFEPLYELSAGEMNDPDFLYHNAAPPESVYNELREPLLTYIHAYELYRRPSFKYFRRRYNRVIQDHVRLRADLARQIDDFCAREFQDKVMIAAHVKHPSHVIEQPDQVMAQSDTYIRSVYQQLKIRNVDVNADNWGVFLATDQDRVVDSFQREFGGRVSFFADVRRTSVAEDERYDALSSEEKAQEGHQVQHLVAAEQAQWSITMAEEVIRDMIAMSRCTALLHVVSNVSTAASYFNPELDLVFTRQ